MGFKQELKNYRRWVPADELDMELGLRLENNLPAGSIGLTTTGRRRWRQFLKIKTKVLPVVIKFEVPNK